MNSLIILVLAVVATQAAVIDPAGTIEYHYPDAAEIEAFENPESRALAKNNIYVGSTYGNWLLRSINVSRDAVEGQIVSLNVIYRTNTTALIWAIQAYEQPAQGASTGIIAGGIGQNYVTIKIQSAVSRGYSYQLSFWGR